MRFCIVMTTINVPTLLLDYAKNFADFGHRTCEAEILIIGDVRTPHQANQEIADQVTRKGVEATYIPPEAQTKWLKKYPVLDAMIPWNSDARRNIGYLMAQEHGAEVIVNLDDDNFVIPGEDFLGCHDFVGRDVMLPALASDIGWLNYMNYSRHTPYGLYPRGYPYGVRAGVWGMKLYAAHPHVLINQGLWYKDPDVDSIARLASAPQAPKVDRWELPEPSIALAPGTWAPINTQNTAVHISLLPAYYFALMGETIGGLRIDRYGDIFQGYFVRKIMDSAEAGVVAYGRPMVEHRRNAHNALKDLAQEFWAIQLTEWITKWLRDMQLSRRSYGEMYLELLDKLRVESGTIYDEPDVLTYFDKLKANGEIWVETVECVRQANR